MNALSGPRYTVNAISMKLVDPKWMSDQIMIIDFGIAFLSAHSSNDIGTPKNYCAPEFYFQRPRSSSSDIWALGCTIFEIRTGACLFRYRGIPTRNQILISMIQMLGKFPDIWWAAWKEGQQWYDAEIKEGGMLEKTIGGTLYQQIMEIGLHDGNIASLHSTTKNVDFKISATIEEESLEKSSSSLNHYKNTDQLIAMVEALTTSEADDVMSLVNKPSSGSSQEKTNSASSNKVQSGSSNAKSGEKSIISSEGITTGVPVTAAMDSGAGAELQASPSVAIYPASVTALGEFLESSGTIISVAEAECLESLLRDALTFLPDDRPEAEQLEKHRWFSDLYESLGTT